LTDFISLFEQMPSLLYLIAALFGLAVGSFLNVLILRLPRMMEQEWREDCAELLASPATATSASRATAERNAPSTPTLRAASAETATGVAEQRSPTTVPSSAKPATHAQPMPESVAQPTSQATSQPAAQSIAQPTAPPPSSPACEQLSLSRPGSHCPACGTRIRPLDNIPILSWLMLRGRCRTCKAPISARYPLVEALTAVLSVIVVWQLGPTPAALAALILTWGLIALSFIDLDTQLLPDSLTLPLLWLGLLLSLGGIFTDPATAILGAATGYLLLWLVFHGFRLATGKEGMGRGDFKLLALFGAWLGWQAVPQILLLSALPGAIVGVALIASGRSQAGQPIPFGPFLSIAGWVSLLWGEAITDGYLRWSGLA
jgi:leader peptidase (prepilin peptidase)/N-methyltransferase